MNAAVLLIIAFLLFYLAYRFYGTFIAKLFEEDDKNPTPAVTMKDDVDYVPTKPLVLFGHHFASIAGGGPIIGPTVALLIRIYACLALGCFWNDFYRGSTRHDSTFCQCQGER